MRVAIVGSRDFNDEVLMRRTIESVTGIDVIVSGGCRGADMLAVKIAGDLNIPVKVFNAEWERLGKFAGPFRNKQIVEYSDMVIAFPIGESKGTRCTIKMALKAGKPVKVIG